MHGESKFITVKQASQIIGLTPQYLIKLGKNGTPGIYQTIARGRWIVDTVEFEKYLRSSNHKKETL